MVWVVILGMAAVLAVPCAAGEQEETPAGFVQTIGENLRTTVRVLGYGTARDVVEPGLNTNGLALQPVVAGIYDNEPPLFSRYQFRTDLRIDVAMNTDRFAFSAKPRLELTWEEWASGPPSDATESSVHAFLNEWFARYRVPGELFLSYGRENLQWGPSFLVSPSNPFDSENGRAQPKQELPGSDYARVVWAPDGGWTVSAIANTAEGRRDVTRNVDGAYNEALTGLRDWRDAQAAQIAAGYGAAAREIKNAIPWGGGVTYNALMTQAAGERDVQTALLNEAYDEQVAALDDWRAGTAQAFEETYALKVDHLMEGKYAGVIASCREGGNPRFGFFGSWNATDATVVYAECSTAEDDVEALVGESYSLPMGGVVAIEYFYNESGNRHAPISQCLPPFRPLDPREVFLRRNYLLLQYSDVDVMGTTTDFTIRSVLNLDDHSSATLALLEYNLADHIQLFGTGTLYSGDRDTEFGSVLEYALTAGLECVF